MKRRPFLRRLLAGVLAGALLGGQAMAFSRQPASWASEQMEGLRQAGLLRNVDTGQGKSPTDQITRGEMLQILVDLLQDQGEEQLLAAVVPKSADYFSDIAGTVSEDNPGGLWQMYLAASFGLTEGSWEAGRRMADCDGLLTREQAAKIMCSLQDALDRYAGVSPAQPGQGKTFADRARISPWALESVDRAAALGILQGDQNGRFDPKGGLTWEQACVMIHRSYQAVKAAKAGQGAQPAPGQTAQPAPGKGDSQPAQPRQVADTRLLETKMSSVYAYPETGQGEQYYLLQDGSVLLNAAGEGSIQVERYQSDGSSAGVRNIPKELPLCGGFFEGRDAYYLAFGQRNLEEQDSKEVYRIVKYDKNWNRLAAASFSGAQSVTTEPYDNIQNLVNVSMAEQDGLLVIHTSRRLYQDQNGVRHQTNFTMKIRQSDMEPLSCSGQYPENQVSHSFAQYVALDNGSPVYADQGDAYPRGFALTVEDSQGHCRQQELLRFYGLTGNNTTNALPGGLGVSASHYLFGGASSPQQGNDSLRYANAFLATVSKDGFPEQQPRIQWLTGFPADGRAYVTGARLAQLNNNTFVLMWQQSKDGADHVDGEFCYAVFDGQGNRQGAVQTKPGFALPLGQPTVVGSSLRWARPVYQENSFSAGWLRQYQLDIAPNSASQQVDYALSLDKTSLSLNVGDQAALTATLTGSDGSRRQVEARYTAQGGVVTVEKDSSLLARQEGESVVTASFTHHGQVLTAQCAVAVKQGGIGIQVEPLTLKAGEQARLKISFTGLPPGHKPDVQFYVPTPRKGRRLVFIERNGLVTAYVEGTVTCSASIRFGKQSASTQFQVTVLP